VYLAEIYVFVFKPGRPSEHLSRGEFARPKISLETPLIASPEDAVLDRLQDHLVREGAAGLAA
jgi:hypothetical protein